MMKLSGESLAAIVKMAKVMAAADGVIKEEEVEAIAMELLRFGVPQDKTNAILEMSNLMEPSRAARIISELGYEERRYVAAFLGKVMAIDGDIDDNELAFWKLVSTICNLPSMNINEALEIMQEL